MKNEVQHGGQMFINKDGEMSKGFMENGKKSGKFTKFDREDNVIIEFFDDGIQLRPVKQLKNELSNEIEATYGKVNDLTNEL